MAEEKEYDNTDKGTLFKNEKKAEDFHDDYKGAINVAGVEYWIGAKVKTSAKDGRKYFSLKVRLKEPKAEKPSEPVAAETVIDDLPF